MIPILWSFLAKNESIIYYKQLNHGSNKYDSRLHDNLINTRITQVYPFYFAWHPTCFSNLSTSRDIHVIRFLRKPRKYFLGKCDECIAFISWMECCVVLRNSGWFTPPPFWGIISALVNASVHCTTSPHPFNASPVQRRRWPATAFISRRDRTQKIPSPLECIDGEGFTQPTATLWPSLFWHQCLLLLTAPSQRSGRDETKRNWMSCYADTANALSFPPAHDRIS